MTPRCLRRSICAAIVCCLVAAGSAIAGPPPPGGESDLPSQRDPCENYGKYPALNADHDRDGLSGYQECQFGSDPTLSDTDHDFLSDGEELQIGTDPRLDDTDGDQLSDCWEYGSMLNGVPTDPLSAGPDADGDQIADDLEMYKGSNPFDFDTDDDMLWDGEEVLPLGCGAKGNSWPYLLDPDRDGDGLDDGVEKKSLGTNMYLFDTDGDGYGDGDEVLKWGTDPLDPNDPSLSNPPDTHP